VENTSHPDIAIIGPGKVGTALGVLCARAGWNVAAVGGGRRNSAQAAARAIGNSTRVMSAAEAAGAADLVLITVPDDMIAEVCLQLARAKAFRPQAVVAHCCGALGSEALEPARACGAHTGSIHPLQTFPTVQAAVEKLPGAFCFIEGSPHACDVLESLAKAIGAVPMRIEGQCKALYHAAAAVASNYLVTLLDAAATMLAGALENRGQTPPVRADSVPRFSPRFSDADRDKALAALAPLVQATLSNVLQLGPERALTGPIARGDSETVRRHLEAVDQVSPQLAAMYRQLGAMTVDLAVRKGTITPETAETLRRVLSTNDTNQDRGSQM
jgi:predicted short-subunit dehydrogenase-like oxidoreductase (DUF2520 family)